jgi:hyperosmotically inducible periplasmic protein
MKFFTLSKLPPALILALLMLGGCSRPSTKSPDVSSGVRQSLDQAGFKDVSVSQDRDKGVVTLGGNVATEDAKGQAEGIARTMAGGQVVANQIAVLPPGSEKIAKTVNSDLDKAIEKNLDAVLVANQLDSQLKYEVKNRVVVLKGDVDSQTKRAHAATLAASVPNVDQVVNEVKIKNQKATSY